MSISRTSPALAWWTSLLPFAFFIFLGKLLQMSNGEYRFDYLVALIMCWGVTLLGLISASPDVEKKESPLLTRVVSLGLLYFSIELALHPQVHYNEFRPAYKAIKAFLIVGVFS